MNTKQLNKVANALDHAFDSFLNGALYPLLACLALLICIFGRMTP